MVAVGIRHGQQRLRVCYSEALFLILHTYLIMYAMRLCFVTIALFSGDQVCRQKEKRVFVTANVLWSMKRMETTQRMQQLHLCLHCHIKPVAMDLCVPLLSSLVVVAIIIDINNTTVIIIIIIITTISSIVIINITGIVIVIVIVIDVSSITFKFEVCFWVLLPGGGLQLEYSIEPKLGRRGTRWETSKPWASLW